MRAYVPCYVESHIRRVYTPVSLCEIIGIAFVPSRHCVRACARVPVCVSERARAHCKPSAYSANQIQSSERDRCLPPVPDNSRAVEIAVKNAPYITDRGAKCSFSSRKNICFEMLLVRARARINSSCARNSCSLQKLTRLQDRSFRI